MRKKAGLFLCLLLVPVSLLLAQSSKTPSDHFMLQTGYYNWLNKPDSIKTKGLGYELNLYLCYDFRIKHSNLTFGTGIGIHTASVFLNKQMLIRDDTGKLGNAAHFFNDTAGEYKRFKFNTVYLQAPFELRYFGNIRNRDKGFKAAIGVQVGALLGAHTKGVRSVEGSLFKEKSGGKKFMNPWNFAATARVGFGHVSIYGTYNITKVFRDANGPELTPFSLGVTLSGL